VKQGGLEIRVAFVTDCGKEMGMGHVMRALKIAKDVASSVDVFFITSIDASVRKGIAGVHIDNTISTRLHEGEGFKVIHSEI
jgi:spore coat polysaccharide biosynthesis predicted glycosyltransferase SpsG